MKDLLLKSCREEAIGEKYKKNLYQSVLQK
jgi:hypothetical protein